MHGLEIRTALDKARIFFNEKFMSDATPYFLPYLSGERTPHNNPYLRGSFHMLNTATSLDSMLYSVIEGISFGIREPF